MRRSQALSRLADALLGLTPLVVLSVGFWDMLDVRGGDTTLVLPIAGLIAFCWVAYCWVR